MIYMAGDNNLSVDMAYALEELQRKVDVKTHQNINLYVYYENNSPEIPPIFCDFSDSENPVFQFSNEIENRFSEQLQTTFQNPAAVNPVLDFASWCSEQSTENKTPAENFALVFSGHTMGFLSFGLLKDESKNSAMTMPDLKKGLEIIRDEITGKKFALLGFDSCVMSMFEVGQQFKPVAETLIASEGTIPNAGWSYADILESLADSGKSFKKTAAEIVQKYIQKQSKYSIGGVSVDMAAWDLSQLDKLNPKLERLGKNLLRCFETENSKIYRQMKRILLQVHYNSQTYMYEQSADLGDFCSLLIEELASLQDETGQNLNPVLRDVSEACKAVLTEIGNCIILSGFSGGAFQFSTGISIFFPWSVSAYGVSRADYEDLSFVRKSKAGQIWNEFLQEYLGKVSRRRSLDSPEKHKTGFEFLPAVQNQTVSNSHKILLNPVNKILLNPVNKILLNPVNKIPLNPVYRMSGETGRFFENFTKFKNTEVNWNIMGYTKKTKINS